MTTSTPTFSWRHLLTLMIASFVFFFWGNHLISPTSPDEVFYAQTASEMSLRGEWMTPYIFGQPQFEKPPFFYWMLKVSFAVFGVNGFAVRFPPAVMATTGVLITYFFSLMLFSSRRRAFMCALVTMSSAVYVGMGRAGLTDMTFSVFILGTLAAFYYGYIRAPQRAFWFILAGVSSALAVLTKGPLGLAIPGVIAFLFLMIRRELHVLCHWSVLVSLAVCTAIALPWYLEMYRLYGSAFTHEFFYNDHWRRLIEAEHRRMDTWFMYPGTMIAGLWPWSLFLFGGLIYLWKKCRQKEAASLFLFLWVVVVFVIFQVAHSKLISYILPLFPALAMIVGVWLTDVLEPVLKKGTASKTLWATWGLVFLMGCAFCMLPFVAWGLVSPYISTKLPLFLGGAALLCSVLGGGYALVSGKPRNVLYVLAIFWPAVFLGVFFAAKDVEPYVSIGQMAAAFERVAPEGTPALTAKFYARGVRFYTGRDVVILNLYGKDYFSPHPIEMIKTEAAFRDFMLKQKEIYAILHSNKLGSIEAQSSWLQVDFLSRIGETSLLRLRVK